VHAGCWSHARRAFFEAAQLNPQDAVAVAIVAQIDKLFAIDAQARREGLDQVGRHALRQQQAPPLLHSIKARIEAAQSTALPASALAKACRYTLALWHLCRSRHNCHNAESRIMPSGCPTWAKSMDLAFF
jgi:transposase